ncbi:hypothetical protein BDY19DRAFT_545182 [Irpex rosettiformis]|uniref:Uncharacterized protein n=1 Tax=Irpex rosettiformis TaxID=378272 RepID=A0ACB8TQU2_9APHY|nr:hypothetical protein BDY19DRAFT_545182 [Irpex rosettiformis]
MLLIRRTYHSLNVNGMVRGTLYTFMLEHGIMYFVLFMVINISQIALINFLARPMNTDVILASSSILVSRFMLHLRESTYTPPEQTFLAGHGEDEGRSQSSWQTIVGSLGETLGDDETLVS